MQNTLLWAGIQTDTMNIIFLDIDGVLNCQLFYTNRKKSKSIIKHPQNEICTERIEWLNQLCKDVNAKVVISSTWRHSGLDYCKDALTKAGATFQIIDKTPDLRADGCLRGNEINLWIEKNKEMLGVWRSDFNSYAIIDDDSDMLYWQRNNLFLTDTYSGLTPNTCYRIKRHFEQLGCPPACP